MKARILSLAMILLSLILYGCSTLGIAVQKAPVTPLEAKKTVIIDVIMSERILPIMPLLDAGIYNTAVKGIASDLLQIDIQKSKEFANAVALTYTEILGAETIRVENTLTSAPMQADYFEKITDTDRMKIVQICTDHSAEQVLAYNLRVVTGSASALGLNGSSSIYSTFYVFDKNGMLAAQGTMQTESIRAAPQDQKAYAQLFDDAKALLPKMFSGLK